MIVHETAIHQMTVKGPITAVNKELTMSHTIMEATYLVPAFITITTIRKAQ